MRPNPQEVPDGRIKVRGFDCQKFECATTKDAATELLDGTGLFVRVISIPYRTDSRNEEGFAEASDPRSHISTSAFMRLISPGRACHSSA
jgi:hypothetical protein